MDVGLDIIAILMCVAFLAGMIDAIAGGGGLVTIPALMAAGIPPVQALATNKLQSSLGTGGAVFAYARKGHIDFKKAAIPTLFTFLGSGLGAYLLTLADPAFLEGLLPLLLLAMVVYFIFAPQMSDDDKHSIAGPISLIIIVSVIGCYDGFFGPGTGSFFTLVLVALFGFGLIRAVAYSKLLNLASNVAALSVLIIGGHVLWILGLCMGAASIIGGQVGAHIAIKFGANIARPLLIIVSLALIIKLISDPTNPLTSAIITGLT